MSTVEMNKIKLSLMAWIHQLSDVDLISFLEGIKNSKGRKDWWKELPEQQRRVILAGLKDAEDGKIISSAEFWKKLNNA